jgi:hypothetical protein
MRETPSAYVRTCYVRTCFVLTCVRAYVRRAYVLGIVGLMSLTPLVPRAQEPGPVTITLVRWPYT